MSVWKKSDPTGTTRAHDMLQHLARLVKHGHKDEAIAQIAGAVAQGFIEAAVVAKEMKVSRGDLAAAVERYRRFYPEPEPKQRGTDRNNLVNAVATEIRRFGGLAGVNPTQGATKIVERLEREGLLSVTFTWKPDEQIGAQHEAS
jgi:microsomal dipeptidase-like Zn-dependent dipeptidase